MELHDILKFDHKDQVALLHALLTASIYTYSVQCAKESTNVNFDYLFCLQTA